MAESDSLPENIRKIVLSPSYRLAFEDVDFLNDSRLRAVRMELELLKPELALLDRGIRSTIVVFGSTRIGPPDVLAHRLRRAQDAASESPDDPRHKRAVSRAERLVEKGRYYELAREFGRLVSENGRPNEQGEYVVVTGGGPGIMEAANRGAYEANAPSIGLNIRLPQEQEPNPYITPELCFQFRYFAIRKLHFLLRAKALIVFPGGFGTLDELFDALTLRQTGRMQKIPIIIFGREYWDRVLNFQALADEGTIDDEDLDLFQYADTVEEAWERIVRFHQIHPWEVPEGD